MSNTGVPVVPGLVSTWVNSRDPMSFKVDMGEIFDRLTPSEVLLRWMSPLGRLILKYHPVDIVTARWSPRVSRLDFMTEVWERVPRGEAVVVHPDPVVGRRWLYEHRFSEMIWEMLPRDRVMVHPAHDPENYFFQELPVGMYERQAAGQSWGDFVAETPAPFVTKVDQARVEAIQMLQEWRHPYPVRRQSTRDFTCEGDPGALA